MTSIRHFIAIAEGLFLENETQYPETASADAVARLAQDIHHQEEDFSEGDLLHRIEKFHTYVLREVPLSEINLGEWTHYEDMSDEYAERLKAGEKMPPIIYDAEWKSLIDGTHRANAAAKAGLDSILAYVGLPEHINPDWQEVPDDDGDYED